MYVPIILSAMVEATWEQDAEKQKELFKKANQEIIQPLLMNIEQQIIKNESGHLVGENVRSIELFTIS